MAEADTTDRVDGGKRLRGDAAGGSGGEAGFLLVDMVMAVSILLVIALVAWPALLDRSTIPRIAATALDSAATLRQARVLAGREGTPASVTFDLNRRSLSTGSGSVSFARDLAVNFVTDRRCRSGRGVFVLTFQPDGRSCGGILTLEKGSASWRVEVNWMTGAVDVVGSRNR